MAPTPLSTLVVTKTDDTNDGFCDPADCSLREAISAAAPGDTITFASPLFDTPRTVLLTPIGKGGLGGLVIGTSVSIIGPGANLLTVGRPAQSDHSDSNRMQIINIGSNVTVHLTGMTISGAVHVSSGGGIHTSSIGTNTTITGCHITGNFASSGGAGIRNNRPMTIVNSTISNNDGGGILTTHDLTVINSTITGNLGTGLSFNGGTTLISSSTITDNDAGSAGGPSGLSRFGGRVTLRNTIVAGGRNSPANPDLSNGSQFTQSRLISEGYNLVGQTNASDVFNQPGDQLGIQAPMLASLALNGGTTSSHALLAGSPAIDKGNSFGLSTDQRGATRPVDDPNILPASAGDNSDIGAFELASNTPTPTPTPTPSPTPTPASSILVVTKALDTNDGFCDLSDCSLREAIAAAFPGDEIVFASPLFDSPQTITLKPTGAGGLGGLVIDKSLTITGKGAQLLTVGRPAQTDRGSSNRLQIFTIGFNLTVNLTGMTISGGVAGSSGGGINTSSAGTITACHITGNFGNGAGGGIRTDSPMTIINSTISNNEAGQGGGIYSNHDLTITNSTITGNKAGSGGGIVNFGVDSVFTSSTITDNEATTAGRASGIERSFGSLVIRNSIIAGNRNSTTTPEMTGPSTAAMDRFVSGGYNLIGNAGNVTDFNQTGDQTGIPDPMLAALAPNVGTTPTHGLLAGSPAIDKGNSFGSTTDQRDAPRPIDDPEILPAAGGDNSDIGAYELGSATAAKVSVSGRVLTSGGRGLANAVVSITDPSGERRSVFTNSLGFYSFAEVPTGRIYTVSVTSKRFRFLSREIQVDSAMNEVDFVGQE